MGGVPVAKELASSLSGDVWLSSFEEPVVTLIASKGEVGEDAVAAGPPTRCGSPARPRDSASAAATCG